MRMTALLGVLLIAGCHALLPFEGRRSGDSRADLAGDARVDRRKTIDALADRIGCDGGCWPFRPANLAGGPGRPSEKCRSLSLGSATTIDTGACGIAGTECKGRVVVQPGGPALCVLEVGTLTVSGHISVQGPNGLVIVAEGAVQIAGTIDASGHGTSPGPGGGAGGLAVDGKNGTGTDGAGAGRGTHCACGEGMGDDCGGGGGGHATDGGIGGAELGDGTSCASSAAGIAYGLPTLVPLIAGSGGASGHNASNPLSSTPGVGGGGGGAIQISTALSLSLAGAIRAAGAGGTGGMGSGGGGGSGGSVLLEAPIVTGGGLVTVAGGGGSGAGTGDDGDPPEAGGAGADGPDGGQAQGGIGVPSSHGAGGNGGTGQLPPTAGGNGGRGGGGGGAAGRIRVNSASAVLPSALRINGHASAGTLTPP